MMLLLSLLREAGTFSGLSGLLFDCRDCFRTGADGCSVRVPNTGELQRIQHFNNVGYHPPRHQLAVCDSRLHYHTNSKMHHV